MQLARNKANNQYREPEESELPEKRGGGFGGSREPDVIEQVAAGLAYGIRNPLTVIKGYLQFYQRNPAYCTREALSLMLREVEDIETVTSGLIAAVRDMAPGKSPQDLNLLLSNLFPVIQAAVRHGAAAGDVRQAGGESGKRKEKQQY